MTPEDLGALFRTFEQSAWRLEARDTYAIPGEDKDFDDFLAGRAVQPRTPENSAWLRGVADSVRSGKYMGRVRIVGHPITDYTRFEFACYHENIAAGEDVRVLDRTELGPGSAWSHQDFWLFDNRIAVVMLYAEDGQFLGVERAPDVAPYVDIQRQATAKSIPFDQYKLVPEPRKGETEVVDTPQEASVVDQ